MSDSTEHQLKFGQRMGLSLGPIPLRLLLAVTFIWAGAGKFFATQEFTGEQALALHQMGAITGPAGSDPEPEPPAEAPAEEADPAPTGAEGGQIGLADTDNIKLASFNPALPSTLQMIAQNETNAFTAADFEEPIEKMALYNLAVILYQGANPGFKEGTSVPLRSIVPQWAAGGKMPVYLAWAASITELVGGALILVGFLTRLSALGLFSVMCGAAWLTVCGPAMQSGDTLLGFLPNFDRFDIEKWSGPMWQLALIMTSASLVFIGAGPVSLSNLLFGSRAEDDDEDYED